MSKTPARKRRKPLFRTESEVEGGTTLSSTPAAAGKGTPILRKRRPLRAASLTCPPTPAAGCSEEKLDEEEIKDCTEDASITGITGGTTGDLERLADEGLWDGGGLEGEEEDLLSGLCPEDLNFSLNTSSFGPDTIPGGPGSIPGDGMEHKQEHTSSPLPVCSTEGGEGGVRNEDGERGFFGLPALVQSLLKEHRGINDLYAWQKECLSLPRVLHGGNLIYCLPTGGGKTLVAEILILRQLLLLERDVLLILPYVSLVQEKVRDLTPFALGLEFVVEEYAGGRGRIPPVKRRRKRVVYVATIEKASGLVNSLAETSQLQSLGLIVVDELHMLGDGGVRGATLEACLTKILCLSSHTQLVGMSATLSNISDLASFLRADTFSSHFRPVELREYVKMGREVYSVEVSDGRVCLHPHRELPTPSQQNRRADPDQLAQLVAEVLPNSCLVFCATKRLCQNVALLLARQLHRYHVEEGGGGPRAILLHSLGVEAEGVCPVLAQTVPVGVAYHHSGLTGEERRLVEEGFSHGELHVLCCTSTLAAGVNLPARRVILRSPYIGNQLLSHTQYRQMVGRAGRKGLAEHGDSTLIANPRDRDKITRLLASPYDRCDSSLLSEDSALPSLILSLVGLKLATTTSDLQKFLQSTLYYQQTHDHAHFLSRCQATVASLASQGYITIETVKECETRRLSATPLGRAAVKGCVPVQRAGQVYRELSHAQSSLVLSSQLHLLFLATPTDHAPSIQPNWLVFFKTLTGLGGDEVRVAEMAGVRVSLLSKLATGAAASLSEEVSRLYRRFYLSLMMHRLMGSECREGRGVWSVAEHFQCSRGFVQSAVSSVASFATCLVHFTKELPELWALHLLLPSVAEQLSLTASSDLSPLLEIPGVKQGRARQLLKMGYSTPESLVGVSPTTLCENIPHLYPRQASRIIQAAKALVRDKAEVLFEEAQDLMAGLT